VASGDMKLQRPQIVRRNITIPYSFSNIGNASWNTNLKTLIDNDCPSGYSVLGVAGWTTNSIYTMVVACLYLDGNYTLQLRHLTAQEESSSMVVQYLCMKD